MNKKGITPVIAIVLLLMMTVAAAAAAYFWMTSIQGTIQTGISSQAEELLGKTIRDVTIIFEECNSTTDWLEVIIQNTGTSDLQAGEWRLILKDPTGRAKGYASNTTTSKFVANSYLDLVFDTSANYDMLNDTDLFIATGDDTYSVYLAGPEGVEGSTTCKPWGI